MKSGAFENMTDTQRKAFEKHYEKELERMYPKKIVTPFSTNYKTQKKD